MGRKKVAPELKKTSKTLTLNQVEWDKLNKLAKEGGYNGPSEFVVEKLGLDKP